jgi:hypothetical protein
MGQLTASIKGAAVDKHKTFLGHQLAGEMAMGPRRF